MRGGMALALAVVVGVGGVVLISLSGPLEDTSSQTDPGLADGAGSQAAGEDARAGGVLGEHDTDDEAGGNAGANATSSSRVLPNATHLTLEGARTRHRGHT